MSLAAVVCVTVATPSPVYAQSPDSVETEAGAPDGGTVSARPDVADATIAQRLQGILDATGWFSPGQVSVREGVAFLDGATGTAEHRAWAGSLAQRTEGVVAVVNRISVDGSLDKTFARAGDELKRFYRQAAQAWPLVLLAAVIAVVTTLAAAAVAWAGRRFLQDRVASPLLRSVLVRTLTVPVFLLGIYFVLQVAGLTRLALTVLGGTGLLGIIIGFAFRDIAENFLASLLLSMRNPFSSGDLIEVAGHLGIVQSLNTRSTVLLTLDGNHVQIPNATVYKSIIRNYSSIPSRRAEFVVGIGYDSPTARAQKLIADVVRDHPAVMDEPDPLVLVDQLGAATVDLRVQYWFDSATYSPSRINSALLRLTKNALTEAGIEMPDPSREVVFPRGVPIVRARDIPPDNARKLPRQAAADDDEDAAVAEGEGSLEAETREAHRHAPGKLPEGEENLLKV